MTLKEKRLARRAARQNRRAERKAKRVARRAKFFEYRFLRVKRFFMVEKHRENAKFLFRTVWTLLAVVAAGLTVWFTADGAGIIAGIIAGAAVGGFLFALQIIVPALIADVRNFRRGRYVRAAQAKEADKWLHAKLAEKAALKQSKAHSKADIKKNKQDAKNDRLIQKDNIKKHKKATKEAKRKEIDSEFKLEIKKEEKTNTPNVKLK